MSATKEHNHDQIEAGQRKQHPIGWLNMPGFKPETWNPIVGCSKVSPGCDNCYAEKMANRLTGIKATKDNYSPVISNGKWNGNTSVCLNQWNWPLVWKAPRMVFVCSMGDLFHESVSFETIEQIYDMMHSNDQHIFIVLTKRPERMYKFWGWLLDKIAGVGIQDVSSTSTDNIWIGVTAENQEQANKRIPILLQIPAAKRFVSIEPMLGPVDLIHIDEGIALDYDVLNGKAYSLGEEYCGGSKLDWVICGGESGSKARPMHPDWVRSLRDQCKAANTSFFFKQWGEWQSYWFNMTSKEVCFKMYSSYLQFTQKNWVNKGDACISLDGKLCKTGGDMQQAQYPVAIMQRLGRKNTGNMIDGVRHQNWPKINL